MSILTFFSGSYCGKASIISDVIDQSGFKLLSDNDLVASAGRLSGMSEKKIARSFLEKHRYSINSPTKKSAPLLTCDLPSQRACPRIIW